MPTFAYVTNANAVSVIDTSTNTVVTSIPVTDPGDYAVIVAITPDGKFAYVTSLFGTVSVINTCTNIVVDTINVGSQPLGIAITPDGRYAYVANSGSDSLSVINTSTNTVVDTIPVGRAPRGVAITPDGNFVYVSLITNAVSVIDIAANAVVDTIPVGNFPAGIAITPDGSFAYVANTGLHPEFSSVSVIDTSNNTVVDTIPVGFVPTTIAITPDGRFAYVTIAADDNVTVIDTSTNTIIDTIPVGLNDYGIAITPEGNFAYVANASDDNVSVIDTNTNTVVDTIPVGNGPFGVAIANIQCAAAPEPICIETTRIFDSCIFEDEKQNTFEFLNLNKDADLQCNILKYKYNILDITKIDVQQDLVDVKLQIKVLLGFTSKCLDDHVVTRVVCFDKNITLTAPEGSDISCDINNVTCICNHTSGAGSSSCSYNLHCTVKVTAVVRSKKLVQIQVPFLGECTPRQCCPDAGMPMGSGN